MRKDCSTSSKQLWQKRPDFISWWKCHGERQRALCLRDYGWYFSLITYGVLVTKSQLKRLVHYVREMYTSGSTRSRMVESIRCLKKAGLDLLSQEDAAAAAPYFDYIIQAMS